MTWGSGLCDRLRHDTSRIDSILAWDPLTTLGSDHEVAHVSAVVDLGLGDVVRMEEDRSALTEDHTDAAVSSGALPAHDTDLVPVSSLRDLLVVLVGERGASLLEEIVQVDLGMLTVPLGDPAVSPVIRAIAAMFSSSIFHIFAASTSRISIR